MGAQARQVGFLRVGTLKIEIYPDSQAAGEAASLAAATEIRRLAERSNIVGEVRGKGLMIGVELVEPGTATPSARAAGRVLEETRARGLLVGKGGLYGNVLRIAPPLSVSMQQAEEALSLLGDALQAAET